MVEFETLKAEEIKFGNNNFIEVARKKAITEEGANEFVAISRGFFAPDGSKRFKKSFTIPDQPEVVEFICKNITEMAAGGAAAEPVAEEEAPAEEPEPEAEEEPVEEAAPEEEAPAEEPAEEEKPAEEPSE
jgi:hypothetical protein